MYYFPKNNYFQRAIITLTPCLPWSCRRTSFVNSYPDILNHILSSTTPITHDILPNSFTLSTSLYINKQISLSLTKHPNNPLYCYSILQNSHQLLLIPICSCSLTMRSNTHINTGEEVMDNGWGRYVSNLQSTLDLSMLQILIYAKEWSVKHLSKKLLMNAQIMERFISG